MSDLLAGKTALILGVANKWSLAYAIAQAFVREGGKLVLTYQGDRQRGTVQDLATELAPESAVLACDVTLPQELENVTNTLRASHTKLDAIVHSIAFANREDLSQPFVQTSREGYLLAQEVSSYSLVAVSRAFAPLMPDGGSILTLSYLGAVRVIPNYNVMGVAKAALEASVRYLAYDLGPSNIRVNAISAGPVKTASARAVKDLSKVFEGVAAHAPLRRNTDPAEVADTAVFLASNLGRGVTGNVIYVDAGYQIMAMPSSGQPG
ncbi:MAG TPA: enoyl-ACP reductase [Bryobacteraceae bacterium]|nr:enoyl-ACP reductase [Bryobacteraceae bacterium]